MDLYKSSIRQLRGMLDRREISSFELTKYFLDRIEKLNKNYNSYITVNAEGALEQARKAQKMIDEGSVRMWTGIPIAVKDNICTKNIRTTCGSRMLENFIPPYDATVIKKLIGYGSVILGKTNMDEFAMGSTSQTSYFGGVKNPFDVSRVPGGSSGGSAACMAAGLAAAALGSDTGGSIRQPASFCGVTGLKPSYGVVSRYGLVAFASSLDQIGVLANSAQDCGTMLDSISDYDPNDNTMSQPNCYNYCEKVGMSLKGVRIGVPKEFFAQGIEEEVKNAVMAAVKEYESMGCEIVEVSLPSLKYAIAAYYLISSAEASSNLARFDGIKYGHRSQWGENFNEVISNSRAEGFGWEVKRRILLGTYALSSGYYDDYYNKAVFLREKIKAEYAEIFNACDCMITPTSPTVAFAIDEQLKDPVKVYLADVCTVTVNIAGLPAISTTCGYSKSGLPIGMSLVGRRFDEATIIGLADAYERGFERRWAK